MPDLLLSGTGNILPSAFSVAPFLKSSHTTIPPTYITHGDADTKVPVRQSRDVAEVLKELKADYVYEEIPGEDHRFDRLPECEMENMYEFINRVFRH